MIETITKISINICLVIFQILPLALTLLPTAVSNFHHPPTLVSNSNTIRIGFYHKLHIVSLSASVFYCLCVDLAADQLQNIMFYPVTNFIFLVVFSICLMISTIQASVYFFPLIQLFSLIFYVSYEQIKINAIIFCRITSEQSMLIKTVLVGLGMISCLIGHIGWASIIRGLVGDRGQYEMIGGDEEQGILMNTNEVQKNNTAITYLARKYKVFPFMLYLLLILLPIFTGFLSLLLPLSTFTHQHIHKHLPITNPYFQDFTTQTPIQISLSIIRIITSAIIFHLAFKNWFQFIKGNHLGKISRRVYLSISIGILCAAGRSIAERA